MTKLRNAAPEALCGNCGRVEVAGEYCSYCLDFDPGNRIVKPEPVDIYAVRRALVRLHGWKSEALCFEITRGKMRLIQDAGNAGFHWSWPL